MKFLFKRWTAIFVTLLMITPMLTAQIEVPPLSPRATTVQRVGFTDITVIYSRPSMRGRVIFGELVPFNQMWRTGANEATVVTFSDPVTINDQAIPKGSYSVFTIPGEDEWEIIFNENIFIRGLRDYNEHDDVLRVKAYPTFLDCHVETFTIDIGELTQTTAAFMISWENTLVKLNIGTNADMRIMSEIETTLNNPMGKIGNTYYSSASYYLENHKDLNKAMDWINEAIKINGEESTYLFLKARIYAEKEMFNQSIDYAQKAKKLALKADNSAYANIIDKHINKWEKM